MSEPVSNPARTFQEAASRVQQQQTQDDETIHPLSRTKFWSHGEKTPRAVLYLHGYTDSTQQFNALGALLFERGYNVFAPRLPYHGYKDRMTRAHGDLTASEMIAWANQATDAALGLGDRLTVMGLSLGGVLATWAAEERVQVDQVLIVSPAYGTSFIPARFTTTAARVFRRLPNFFLWWDPRVRAQAGFEYTYPRFATRTLAQAFLLSDQLLTRARQQPPAARTVWMITNANDFAVNNAICDAFVAAWRAHKTNQVFTFQFPRELNIPHDVMDPNDPGVKPKVIYPRLIEIIQQAN